MMFYCLVTPCINVIYNILSNGSISELRGNQREKKQQQQQLILRIIDKNEIILILECVLILPPKNYINFIKIFLFEFVIFFQKLIAAHRYKWWHRIFPREYRKFNGEICENGECYGWNDTGTMPIDGQNGSYLLLDWYFGCLLLLLYVLQHRNLKIFD